MIKFTLYTLSGYISCLFHLKMNCVVLIKYSLCNKVVLTCSFLTGLQNPKKLLLLSGECSFVLLPLYNLDTKLCWDPIILKGVTF